MPPGGHIEPGELPEEAAVRETLEETGVVVEIVSSTVPDTNSVESFILKQPLCLHQVKAFENDEHIYHIDIVYLCRPSGKGSNCDPHDVSRAGYEGKSTETCSGHVLTVKPGGGILQAKWVRLEELKSLTVAPNVPEVVELALLNLNAYAEMPRCVRKPTLPLYDRR